MNEREILNEVRSLNRRIHPELNKCKWMTDVCVLRSQQPHYHTIMRANDRAVNLSCRATLLHPQNNKTTRVVVVVDR